jgi:hypothetical protein
MQTARYKKIIVALLMMVFIGQVVASANVSCQSQSSSSQLHNQMADSDMMDHSQHIGAGNSMAQSAAGSECCADCDCSLGGCASAVLLASQSVFAVNPTLPINTYNGLVENPLVISLFRPPISR